MRHCFLRMLLLIFSCGTSNTSIAQYITTIIGDGNSACYLNDQPPLCIPVSYPESVCAAINGDIFFTCGNAIKKLSAATGIVTRIAGSDSYGSSGDNGPALNALFKFARVVKMDKQENLYIAEYSGNRVRKINKLTGIITSIAGNGIAGYSGDGGLAVNASINTPQDLAIDNAGNIFIADFLNSRIRRIDAATGIISTFAGIGATNSTGDGGVAVNAGIPYPNSICLDTKDNLYISESRSSYTCRIRKIANGSGIITTIAGTNAYAHSGDGGPAINADLFDPSGVLVDSSGNVFIAQYDDSRIRKIDAATGIILTVAGTGINGFSGDNGLAVNAALKSPIGLAFDQEGNLLICDNQNLRIRKLYTHATAPPTGSPVIVISAPTSTICNGTVITFTAIADYTVAGFSYVWTKNGVEVTVGSAQWTGTGLQGGDVIMCTLQYPVCGGTTKVLSNTITLTGVAYQPLSIAIVADKTSICKNEMIVFTANSKGAGTQPVFQWKLNGNNAGINSTTYSSTAFANGDVISCEVTAAAAPPCFAGGVALSNVIATNVNNIMAPSVVIITSANKTCANTTVTLKANVQNAGSSALLQWKLNGINAGDNTNQFSISNPVNNDEIYCVISANSGCIALVSSNTIKLSVESPPSVKLYPSDTVVIIGSQVQLHAVVNGPFASYTWTPSINLSNSSSLMPLTTPLLQNNVYSFRIVTTGGCAVLLTAVLKVEQQLFMPNAFTPDNNVKNDKYRIPPNTSIQLQNFSIYNRWGKKVFSTADINAGWNGNVNNINQNTGAYIYIITGVGSKGTFVSKGTFLLIR